MWVLQRPKRFVIKRAGLSETGGEGDRRLTVRTPLKKLIPRGRDPEVPDRVSGRSGVENHVIKRPLDSGVGSERSKAVKARNFLGVRPEKLLRDRGESRFRQEPLHRPQDLFPIEVGGFPGVQFEGGETRNGLNRGDGAPDRLIEELREIHVRIHADEKHAFPKPREKHCGAARDRCFPSANRPREDEMLRGVFQVREGCGRVPQTLRFCFRGARHPCRGHPFLLCRRFFSRPASSA